MADFSADLDTYTLQAAADLSALQYHIVRGAAINTCNVASNAVDSDILGVLQNKPTSGHFATIADGGISKVVAGGAVTVYDLVTCNGSGRAATVTSGQIAFGKAFSTSANDGELISVRLMEPIRWSGAP